MAIKEIRFKSYNGRDTIKAWSYTPIVKPRAVVQIVHGFGEHSRRYMHMILAMLDAGFVVCADDHVGHGKTAQDSDTWGDHGDNGYITTREDERTLHNMLAEQYPDLPYFMFGHSWGSLIARDYAAVYGEELAGLIICGTLSMLENTLAVRKELKDLVDAGKGSEVKAEYIGKIFGGFTSRYEHVRTPSDWVAKDPGVVADHGSDPLNNLSNPSNIQSLYDVMSLWADVSTNEWAEKIPNIPLYIIAGDQDPVGNFGEGVYHVANSLWNAGKTKITTKIYSGYRHEIHNEPEIRDEVEAGIIEFIDAQL